MANSSSNGPPGWPSSSSQPLQGHLMYRRPREDEPSSSVPTSTSRDFSAAPSCSLTQSTSYRGNPVFADNYDVQGSAVSSHMYQPAESSYQGGQPEPQPGRYAELNPSENEAQIQLAGYNNIDDEAANYGGAQSVASSSGCDEAGYPVHQLIVDAQNRILSVQRVISPDVDSTVSQSLSSRNQPHRHQVDNGGTSNSSVFLQPSTSGRGMINARFPSTQSEVTTSDDNRQPVNGSSNHGDSDEVQGHGEVEVDQSPVTSRVFTNLLGARRSTNVMESAVSSITGSSSNEAEVTMVVHVKGSGQSLDDIVSGEPDTTQTDEEEDYPSMEKDYGEDSPSTDNREDINSSLVSVDNQSHPSSGNNMIDFNRPHPSQGRSLPSSDSNIMDSSRQHLSSNRPHLSSDRPHQSNFSIMEDSSRPLTSTGINMVTINRPHPSSGISLVDSNRPHPSSGISMVDSNRPHPSTGISMVDSNRPHPSSGISMVDSSRPHPSTGISMVDSHRSHPSTGISMIDSNRPHPSNDINMVNSDRPHPSSDNHMVDSNRHHLLNESNMVDNRPQLISCNNIVTSNRTHYSSGNNLVDSTQIMSTRTPLSGSSMSGHPLSMASMIPGFMTTSVANSYSDNIHSSAHSHMASNGIGLSHLSTNQIGISAASLASSMDNQINQINYIFDNSSAIDTSMKLGQTVFGTQMTGYMYSGSGGTDEPQPGTSSQPDNTRRKSIRIAELDSEVLVLKKLQYESKPYNLNQLWCEECMQAYDEECTVHKLTPIQDKIVFSRAWASLPPLLQIFKISENDELGVFSKRTINKRTQFGPFIAELVDSPDKVNASFPVMVERDGEVLYYQTADENKCNWMMFVRPAESYAEQNLVVYQHENDIYFTVTKDITEPRTELKVWYAAHYAERWDKPLHEATEQDLIAIEEQLCKFQCYECPKRFRTAAALQKHLIFHDADGPKNSTSEEPSSSQTMPPPRQRRKRVLPPEGSAVGQKYLNVKKEPGGADNTSSQGMFHWKKRSTNIYLNKTLKKYQKRIDGYVRKSLMNYFPKLNQNTELGCAHCDLAFSNNTLLSWHILSHNEAGQLRDGNARYMLDSQGNQIDEIIDLNVLDCPACSQKFYYRKDLIDHVASHGAPKSSTAVSSDYHSDIMFPGPNRAHRCGVCFKTFTTLDRLAKHHMCHGDDSEKPFQCTVCFKRFMNNSALSCHMKVHSTAKYYQCPICHLGFDQTSAMREHSLLHANPNGTFTCPHCEKIFSEFLVLKKHVRGFHTNRTFPCSVCEKQFPRADKLRLHMLRHSNLREFMCDTCGRQFKRKDKLKEHIKRMHSAAREERDRLKAMRPRGNRFIPKVSPTEYHRFIYKCHLCLLGFKRRGMLVNHIAKRHPDLKPDSVPELNLPILKTQRDYYCQYCDKVYKSSSKRKAHILKNHPGSELPQSARKKSNIDDIPGIPNPTYSQTVGSITTMPHQCEHCHKQYASKAKLLQHHRKHHPETAPQVQERVKRELIQQIQGSDGNTYVVESVNDLQDPSADLLTQAMSELTQSVEFRQISGGQGSESTFLTTRLGQVAPTMVQIQTSTGSGTQTIELTHLSQALQHFAPPQGHLPIQVQVTGGVTGQIQIPISAAQAVTAGTTHIVVDAIPTTDTSSSPTQVAFSPISIVSGAYIPKTWTNYNYKQS